MTPYEIDILIHYHSCTSEWDGPSYGNPLWISTMDWFVDNGLLEFNSNDEVMYKPTERLHCFIEYICSLPLPCWKMPNEKN